MDLPHTIVLHLHSDPEDGEDGEIAVDARVLYDDRAYDLGLGTITMVDDSTWESVFGDGCRREGDVQRHHDAGPGETIGILLDDALDNPELEENEADEDEDDAKEIEDEEHESGRRWHLVSRTSDSITKAMQVGNGVLLRIETFGDGEGEYAMSSNFIPDTTLLKVLTEMDDWETP